MTNTHTPTPADVFRAAHEGHDLVQTPNLIACQGCDDWAPTPAVGGPMTCKAHPAYHADYCPVCGTAVVIGGTR